LVHPYNILGLGIIRKQRQDYLKYGDSLYMVKRQYPSYEVSLSSIKGFVFIDLISS
jgi:hypothetical protein